MESLYEELSLFDRDLLPATGSLSNKNADLIEVRDVGEEWLSPAVAGDADTLSMNEAVLFPELLSPASPPEETVDVSVPEPNWLDTQTNLLDFLGDSSILSQQPVIETPPVTDIVPVVTDVSAINQQVDKIGYEIVCIPSLQDDSVFDGSKELEMSLMEVVNNLAGVGSLEEGSPDLIEILEQPQALDIESVLSPISVEEVESLLSSHPTSPSSCFDDSGFVDDISDDPAYSPGPVRATKTHAASERSAPYHKRGPKSSPNDSKQRKKQQNKDAALRYRQKKKAESRGAEDECTDLEERNKELKDKVDGLTREIGYLKDLMTEVYKAKGITLPSVLSSPSSEI